MTHPWTTYLTCSWVSQWKREKKKSNTLHLTGMKRKNGMSLLRRMTVWLNLKFIWYTKEWTTPGDKNSCHLVCVLDIIVGTLQISWPVTFTKFLKLRFVKLSFRILTCDSCLKSELPAPNRIVTGPATEGLCVRGYGQVCCQFASTESSSSGNGQLAWADDVLIWNALK